MKSNFMTAIAAAALIFIATSFVIMQQIQAQEGNIIITFLSGKEEVPPTSSDASAWAKFQSVNSGQIAYWVSITGLNKITGAHLHDGVKGQNGGIVAVLSGNKSADAGGNGTISLTGNITKNDLQGPLKGKEISDLVNQMKNSSIYVNVHTDEYKDGAIRGQIG